MANFEQALVAGVVVSATIPPMYYFNKAVLASLFAVNKAVGKALGRLILPPPHTFSFESTCNNKKCPIDGICPCDGYHCICYNCQKEEPKP